ncbi:branched-chain amino acid aminotransferase [Brevibacillus sp. DP1.3A]|uniref:branched-chain amino acid aminotransferase n=1 Tax=unclassified Brevibacillus TaxID=2684853 RepID=UPI00156B2ADD|nr:branched-chain amino acid aminotransferase [Brevibacillus sp. DP1.3A]UED73570.1 branched-chain amino acid aminotransferase [Brevibacillus sp. DP1.3A]
MECQLTITRTEQKKEKPASDKLGFGVHFTDHMFTMDYTEGKGWHDPQIVPYSPLTLDPAAMVFHYGQAVFEGLKAYRNQEGKVRLFRPDQNFKRMNRSLERMSMPLIDEEFMVEALKQLVAVDKEWIPTESGQSLYIRPFVIATEPCFGVRASYTYKLVIVLSPVGAYYAGGMKPVKIYVENNYVRAVRGGTGNAKVAGNYAGGLKAQVEAKEKGYEQVLWLDGVENKYIEEVGSMNVFFKVKGEVWTPSLNGSILEGITRDSTIQLLKDWGIPVVEKRISMEDLHTAYVNGELEEAFGTGTAAVISPVGDLNWNGHQMIINGEKTGELTTRLYDEMTGIQYGEREDKFGWSVEVTE